MDTYDTQMLPGLRLLRRLLRRLRLQRGRTAAHGALLAQHRSVHWPGLVYYRGRVCTRV